MSSVGCVPESLYLPHPRCSNDLFDLPDPTNGQLGFFQNLVPRFARVLIFFLAGLLSIALRARYSLGAFRIPLETGLLISSLDSILTQSASRNSFKPNGLPRTARGRCSLIASLTPVPLRQRPPPQALPHP